MESDKRWSGKVGGMSGDGFEGSSGKVAQDLRTAAIRSRPESRRLTAADRLLFSVVFWGWDLGMNR